MQSLLTVCGDDRGASREALDAVHEHYAASVDGLVNEAARDGHVDEQVGIVDVLDADAQVADARGGVVGGDGLGAHGDYVRDTPVSERPGRDGSVDPAKARRGFC